MSAGLCMPPGAAQAAQQLAAGELRASALLEQCLARIARHNPAINALVTLDEARARRAAAAVDALLAQGVARFDAQPLLGLPVSIKDAFATQGLRTTSSHAALAHYLPPEDASLVARLKSAGAVVVGKSNLSELAGDPQCWSPLFGPTRNPWNPTLTPGGSSGGSAAAIAMGFSLLELGSDIGGSIRIPAAYCGVAGFKASENRLPRSGHIPHLPGTERSVRHLLSFGLLARRVADLQLALPRLVGPDGLDSETPPLPWRSLPPLNRPLRIAWWDDFAGLPLCARTAQALAHSVQRLQAAGHDVQRCAPAGFDWATAWQAFGVLAGSEIGLGLPRWQRWLMAHSAGFLPRHAPLSRAFLHGTRLKLREYQWALNRREQLISALDGFLGEWDAWLCPTALTTAYPAFALHPLRPPRPLPVADQLLPYIEATLSLTTPFSLTGSPVLSLPAGAVAGVPVGLQLVGWRCQDEALLQVGAQVEAALGPWQAPPDPDQLRCVTSPSA